MAAANFTLPNKREAPSILSLSTTIHKVEKLLKYVSFDLLIFRNFEVEKRQNHKAEKSENRKSNMEIQKYEKSKSRKIETRRYFR